MNIHGHGHTIDVAEQSADRLIPLTKARETIGVSRSKFYLLLAEADFPARVKIGRNNYFSERELQSWIRAKLVAREAGRN